MIRFGEKKDIPGLKKLWKECFADEDAYINAFFKALYKGRDVLLEEENGMLMGASFFLPGKLYSGHPDAGGQWQEIRYVYALAVAPQFRRRGIAGELLRSAYVRYHAPLIAEPAEEGLVGGFYRPLGFSEVFYLEKKQIEMQLPAGQMGMQMPQAQMEEPEAQTGVPQAQMEEPEAQTGVPQAQMEESEAQMKAPEVYDVRVAEVLPQQMQGTRPQPDMQFFPVGAAEYCRIRDAHFKKHGYVSWPTRHVAFAIQQHRGNGGGAFAINRAGREGVILYYKEGQDIVVTETTLTEQEVLGTFIPQVAGQCGRLILTSAAEPMADMGQAHRAGKNALAATAAGSVGTSQDAVRVERDNATQKEASPVVDCRRCLTGMGYGLAGMYGYLNLSLD